MFERKEILTNIRNKLFADSCEGALISSDINRRYVSGFNYTDGYILLLPQKAYLLADSRYIEAAMAEVRSEAFEILLPEGTMLEEISLLLEIEGIKKLYVEENTLSLSSFENLKKKFKKTEICAGASVAISACRAVKLPWELEKIAEAQRITDMAFEHILKFIKPNMTEKEVALELEFFMRSRGAERTAFDTVTVSGSASSLPHGVPRNVALERGFLTMDFGAMVDGYCSDMTRTVCIGKVDTDMKKLYSTVFSAQLAALDIICEGIECRRADETARNIIDSTEYKGCFGHSLGHGVGMYIHEEPRLSSRASSDERLCRGNVVTVEPGIYVEGKYGCRIEDMIAISHSGDVINFTRSSKELIEL